MLDQYGRNIDYMRISVTDRCNLRCRYCMPHGVKLCDMADLLTFEEIALCAQTAAQLGIRHIKLTGGEPLIRRGLDGLVRMLKASDGIEQVTLTTNGTMLEKHLDKLVSAGLDAVNISLDTMDRRAYEEMTGTDAHESVLSAIKASVRAGLRTKVNAVCLPRSREEILALIDLAKADPVDVRFIEMMPIGYGKEYTGISNTELLSQLQEIYPGLASDPAPHGFGPAIYFKIPGYIGSIGLISAIHGKFCSSCNRVRLTSKGFLKPCLCYDTGTDLRQILRSEQPSEEREKKLLETMRTVIFEKPKAHCFENEKDITEESLMSAFGG